jgi:hypothetical protein
MKKLSTIFAIFLLSSLCSCSSHPEVIRPQPQVDEQASFDGDAQDSGLVEMSNGVALVSAHFVERYNAMIQVYGTEAEFMPALKEGDGVTPASAEQLARHPTRGSLSLMSARALVNFIKMNQWRKMGRVPAAKKPAPGIISRVIQAALT